MRPELITALQAISEGVQLLRTGNPNHKASGPGGGQFTNGGGGSGGGANTHGKHFAKRQRRRQRKLEKLRQKGHARIAELKGKHSKERNALRTSHREKGTSYSDRRSEYQALRTKHRGESRQTVDTIKKEVREAFPKSTGKSSKAKEFRERVEKGTQKLGETHAKDRQATIDRHTKEREDQSKRHQEEREYTKKVHAEERSDLVETHKEYHKEDAQRIVDKARESLKADHEDQRMFLVEDHKRQWKDSRLGRATKEELTTLKSEQKADRDSLLAGHKEERKSLITNIKGELDNNTATHSGRLKDALHAMRQDHAEQHAELKDEHGKERQHLAKSHRDTRKWMDKAHKAERREAITRLKQEIQGRSYGDAERWDLSAVTTVGRIVAPLEAPTRMHRSRTHKANSAESILKHVLRQRGWTVQYDGASLTGRQHLSLLDDVRQYGRMWLRHEAESFFDRYGVEVDERDELGRSFGDFARAEDVSSDLDSGRCCDAGVQAKASEVVSRGVAGRAAGALGRFFDRAGQFIRELIVAGAMALKGDDHLTNAEIYAVDRLTRKQYEYLDKFKREVLQNPPKPIADLSSQIIVAGPPPMTEGQFVARLEQYGNSVWGAGNSLNRDRVRQVPNAKLERRFLGHADHCEDCPPLAAQGWQPLGTLPDIGDTECGGQCHCHFEYQDGKGKTFLTPEDYERRTGPPIKKLPSGPGPQEKPPRKIKLKPRPEPKKPDREFPNVPTLKELLEEAGSPYPEEEYEKA